MTAPGLDLSVVVPCFRSGPTLPELAERLDAALAEIGGRSEILFVDDGSDDDTWPRIVELAARLPRVWGLHLATRVGQHRATLAGLGHATGDVVVTLDDDLEHRPEDIARLVGALRAGRGIDCAIAGFSEEHRPALRRAASVVMDRMYRLRFGGFAHLQMTSFRAMTRDLAGRLVANAGEATSLPHLLRAHATGILNVPVTHAPSRMPSRYTTLDLMRFAWRALEIPTAANRSQEQRPLYRVRSAIGRDPTIPRGPDL